MIVLPNTPPAPRPLNVQSSELPPHILALRATIDSSPPTHHAESVRYVMKLQEYLESIFSFLAAESGNRDVSVLADKAAQCELGTAVPWTNVKPEKLGKTGKWTLANEILVAIVAASFMYTRLGAELANELIEGTDLEGQDQKWKAVSAHYKNAIGLCLFGAQFRAVCVGEPLLSLQVFILLDQVCNVGIQMLLLCKALWLNRMSFTASDTFESSNNGVLCRVAIWVLEEIKNCQNLTKDMQKSSHSALIGSSKNVATLELNYDNWSTYLAILEKYASSYAALFLSIEYYQKNKLGHAIGLVNYALLSIQSKNTAAQKPSKAHLVARIKNKLAEKRNERYISNLQSITSLRIDKSVFLDSSGVVLNDLNFVFDQLILFRLKLQKENDNIKFDTVVDWLDVHTDSKWPLGCKIPVSAVADFVPRALESKADASAGSSQRQYY